MLLLKVKQQIKRAGWFCILSRFWVFALCASLDSRRSESHFEAMYIGISFGGLPSQTTNLREMNFWMYILILYIMEVS